ncbi:MAG: hypothetical protein OEN56_01365 [Gemmatimonadota bacterium]|nr:hypothetical protein [Gemmatimonadota bacterium]
MSNDDASRQITTSALPRSGPAPCMERRRGSPWRVGVLGWTRSLTLVLPLLWAFAACGGSTRDGAAGSDAAVPEEAFVPPRDTDILVAELLWETAGPPSIGAPTNLTRRPDYDNQPSFVPDGSGLWYTVNDPQAGQADIWRYDFASATVAPVTQSNPESEYSATPLPSGDGVSVIRVEADSTQRLWRFDLDGSNGSVLLANVAPVGYHAWVDENTVVMFVLGAPPTLQVGDLRTGRARVVTEDIGRSIQRIPDSFDVSFVQRHEDGTSTIMRLPGSGGDPTPIIEAVGGGDFHAWAPDGTLLMAQGPIVYAAVPAETRTWTPVADFSDLRIVITRLAVSPDASQIALVAEVAPLDAFPGN